jgi:hypothetical protein
MDGSRTCFKKQLPRLRVIAATGGNATGDGAPDPGEIDQ